MRGRAGLRFAAPARSPCTSGARAAAAAAALLTPAAAQAATRTVYAGPPVAKARALPENATGNAFYPRSAS